MPLDTHILLLHDAVGAQAPPDEQDTLIQLAQIEAALTRLGYSVTAKAFDGDLLDVSRFLQSHRFDLVFNLVETFHGSRFLHAIPLMCEQLGIRVTGGNANSLFLTGDKLLAKRLLRLAGIPTPDWIDPHASSEWATFIGGPLIRKPWEEEASVGIDDASVFTCQTMEELARCVHDAEARRMMIERYIDGRECNISVSSSGGKPKIHPIAEMVFTDYPADKPKIVGYEAKWLEHSFAYNHTIRSFAFSDAQPEASRLLRETVEACWSLFDCTGYARVDIRLDDAGTPYVLELNMNPCLAQDSGYIAACAEEGLTYDQAIGQIVEEALHGDS